MINIKVTPPNEKIVTNVINVSLDEVFLQKMFSVEVDIKKHTLKFLVNLPEWLLALTAFLNSEARWRFDTQLLLSGEHFVAIHEDDEIKIKIFDLNQMKIDWLFLTMKEAIFLHSKLISELIDAVRVSAGRELQIRDIDRLQLKQ